MAALLAAREGLPDGAGTRLSFSAPSILIHVFFSVIVVVVVVVISSQLLVDREFSFFL
jgi:hypothetical protein